MPSPQIQHHRVGFGAELPHVTVDKVVIEFVLVLNCAAHNQR